MLYYTYQCSTTPTNAERTDDVALHIDIAELVIGQSTTATVHCTEDGGANSITVIFVVLHVDNLRV
jgi:hypothetical protein